MSNFNYSYSPTFKQLNPDEYNVQDFVVHKLWQMDNTNYSSSYGVGVYNALYPDYNTFPNGLVALNSSKYTSITSSNQDTHVLWHYLHSNFYNGEYAKIDLTKNDLKLYQSASLITIPTDILSEGLKTGTFELTVGSTNITDDSNGNLIDNSYNINDIIDSDYLIGYWGFNDKFQSGQKQFNYNNIIKDGAKNNNATFSGVNFTPGIMTQNIVSSSGLMATFDGDGSIQIKNNNRYNFKPDDEFAISFWVNLPNSQSDLDDDTNNLISKKTIGTELVFDQAEKKAYNKQIDLKISGYPFDFSVYNSNHINNGKLKVSRKGGSSEVTLISDSFISGSDKHILYQKTGSTLELYIDGILEVSSSDTVNGNTINNSDIWLGNPGTNTNKLSGSIDEFRIYNKSLTENEINSLFNNDYNTGSAYQDNKIGNIFYKTGQVVITDPRPKYNDILESSFNLSFRNKYRIYEHEALIKLKESDFNLSLNPTLRVGEKEDSQKLKSFVTGSWKPYITTIGLYNQNYELLAVAKLARPVEKRNDVPMNFIVRFDI